MSLTALVAWPSPSSALVVESNLSDSSILLGNNLWIDGDVTVRHPGPGFADNVVVSGDFPPGYVVNDVTIEPSVLIGEIWWNDNDYTRLLTNDMNGNRIDELFVTLTGLPTPASPCGFYGMDVHPQTGDIYGIIGLYPGGGCDYTTARDLFRIDPISGVATWIGSPPVTLNGLFFTPGGTLIGHGAQGASRRGGLYTIGINDGSASLLAAAPIPGSTITWDDPAMAGMNPDDGLAYHFQACDMATTNPSTKVQTPPTGTGAGCPNNAYHWVSYIGNGQFLISEWGSIYLFDLATNEWDYIDSFDEGRGAVVSGHWQSGNANCVFTDTTFTCEIPRIIPRGQWRIFFEGDFDPLAVGDAFFDINVVGGTGEVSNSHIVKVVAADLKAVASADATRVDQTDVVVWTLEAENLGSASAANTQLVIRLPANQTYNSVSALGGTCGGTTTITCNMNTVQPGNLARVVVRTTANADGISDVTVDVSTSSAELTQANNSASVRVVVGPAADLAVTATRPAAKDASAPTDMPGKPIDMSFVVTNQGPNDAVDVNVYHKLPSNVELSSAKAGQGSCAVANGQLTCNLGTIAVNKSVAVELSPTVTKAGSYAMKASAESFVTPDMNLANNEGGLTLNVTPPSVQVAAGKSPRSVSGEKASLAQLVLTHGGQTDQDLTVKSLTFEAEVTRLRLTSVRVLVIDDADGDGRADADEGVIGNGELTINGEASVIRLTGDGLELKKGESKTVVIVLRDSVGTQVAAVTPGASMAVLGLLPLALVFGLRRRKVLPLASLAFVLLGAVACSEEDVVEGAKVQLTLTAAEVELAEGPSPAAPVEGLPLALPTVEVN